MTLDLQGRAGRFRHRSIVYVVGSRTSMAHPVGESDLDAPRLIFGRRLKLEFHGSSITSDAGLLAYRELDDALGLTLLAGGVLCDSRRGKNTRHLLIGLLCQSVFGRFAGYENVNDAEHLARDPAACQSGSSGSHRPSTQAPDWTAAARSSPLPRQLRADAGIAGDGQALVADQLAR